MKRIHFFSSIGLFLFLILICSTPRTVLADGILLDEDTWDYSDETNQQAFINYGNGVQKMIISIGFAKSNKDLVWIFPIPANPNEIKLDIIKDLPYLDGKNISIAANQNLRQYIYPAFIGSQLLYNIPFLVTESIEPLKTYSFTDVLFFDGEENEDISVYSHLDKEGISSEIITAKTSTGLYTYLQNKGLNIEKGTISTLESYMGENYSFIVSWINTSDMELLSQNIKKILDMYFSDIEILPKFSVLIEKLKGEDPNFHKVRDGAVYLASNEGSATFEKMIKEIQKDSSLLEELTGKNNIITIVAQKGVFVTFPTKEAYFPLIPTSAYKNKMVPAQIKIIGNVTPKVFDDIKEYTDIRYYIDKDISFDYELKDFYDKGEKPIEYTQVEIRAPSKAFTQDLWFRNQTTMKVRFLKFLANYPVIFAIVIFLASSIVSSILSGVIVFKNLRKNILKLCSIGIFNIFTITGFIAAISLTSTKAENPEAANLISELKLKGYYTKRRTALVLYIMCVPFFIYGIILALAMVRGIVGTYSNFIYYQEYNLARYLPIVSLIILSFMFYILPITALLLNSFLEKIKTEDKILFEQIGMLGYSTWSFTPKDKFKILFVFLFSAFFLMISLTLLRSLMI